MSNHQCASASTTRADRATGEKMEEWAIDNLRLALKTGKLKSPIFEQEQLTS